VSQRINLAVALDVDGLRVYSGVIISSQMPRSADLESTPLISIVDDDEPVREAINELVSSLGYRSNKFASAEEFLNSNRLNDTSCLITDVRMPGLSGIELQCCLIAQGRTLPIIFITALNDERTRVRALTAGAIGFLTKPFDEGCLIKCLDAALSSRGTSTAS
jgi:FixJ family two-component response regulator